MPSRTFFVFVSSVAAALRVTLSLVPHFLSRFFCSCSKHGAPPPAPGKIGHKPVASSSSSTVGEQHRKNKRKHERGSGSPGKLQKKEISHVQCRACQVWVRTDKTGITPERAAELWDYYCTECVAANKIPCRLCTQPLASFGNPTVTLLGCQMTRLRDRGQTYYNTKPAHEACAHTHGLPFCGACKLYATDAVTGRATYCPACRVPFV